MTLLPKFQCLSFKPTEGFAKHAQSLLLSLIDFAPAGASISAYISKVKSRYQCLIQVRTPATRFVQNTLSDSPARAFDAVNEKIKSEMREWQLNHLRMEEPSFWNFKELKG
jgi:hypothetical protein